jgi:hypothetical protein
VNRSTVNHSGVKHVGGGWSGSVLKVAGATNPLKKAKREKEAARLPAEEKRQFDP